MRELLKLITIMIVFLVASIVLSIIELINLSQFSFHKC